MTKTIRVQYFALLRDQRGLADENLTTAADTPAGLYAELHARHGFTLPMKQLRVAVNDEFAPWDAPLQEGDTLVFIPPVAGG
jgi:molybdopterin converting factor subunit 1